MKITKVLQMHPTLRCDENCTWCVYSESKSNMELPITEIGDILLWGIDNDYSILKISGGGEPTLYRQFIEMLYLARLSGYKIYLQTHGKRLTDEIRRLCDDIRVSGGDGRPFTPPIVKSDGFSYVVSSCPDYANLNEMIEYAVTHNGYVRVTQDDTDIKNVPSIREIQNNIAVDFAGYFIKSGVAESERLNPTIELIRFWDARNYHTGINPCPCFTSPLFGADGYWYPCCKTHCAKELISGYNTDMRLGRNYPGIPYDGSDCRRCYY